MGSEMCIRDRFQILLYIYNSNNHSPVLIPPRNVCKPQPNWLLVNVLKLKVPARGESCPSGPRRGPAEPGGDKVLSPNQKSFHISTTNCNTLATKTGTPLSILPL